MTDRPTGAEADALARLYDLDLAEDPGDVDLYLALAARTAGPVLELAAGTGRVAVPLAAAGHQVVGLDIDAAALARARTRASGAASGRLELVEGDLLAAASNPAVTAHGPYRLAILALNSILLLPSPGAQRAALQALAGTLAPGGLAVVDMWLPTVADLAAFDGRLSLEWLRRDPETGHDVTKTVAAWLDPVQRLVTLTTIFESSPPGGQASRWIRRDALRLATADELADYAGAAGLELETLAGDHGLGPLDAASERVVMVARRPETELSGRARAGRVG